MKLGGLHYCSPMYVLSFDICMRNKYRYTPQVIRDRNAVTLVTRSENASNTLVGAVEMLHSTRSAIENMAKDEV